MIIVDASIAPMLAQYVKATLNVKHVIVANGPASAFEAPRASCTFDELIAGEPTVYDWPEIDERDAAVMLHLRHHRRPEGRGLQPPQHLAALHAGVLGIRHGSGQQGLGARDRADVPRDVVGPAVCRHDGRPTLVMPDRFLQPEPLLAMMAAACPTFAAAVPTIWQGVAAQLKAAPQDISHLREVVVGGAAVPRR